VPKFDNPSDYEGLGKILLTTFQETEASDPPYSDDEHEDEGDDSDTESPTL
jgi:hypothetical protein